MSQTFLAAYHGTPASRAAVQFAVEFAAARPVLVVPADRVAGRIRSIVVAYDDSTQARAALREAERLARAFEGRLKIVAAHEPQVFAGPAMVAAGRSGQPHP